jgi:hypothetical protein
MKPTKLWKKSGEPVFPCIPTGPGGEKPGIAEDTLDIRKIRIWPLTNLASIRNMYVWGMALRKKHPKNAQKGYYFDDFYYSSI